MTVTIYHNPRCTKSRETLDLIRGAGIEPKIVEYLKDTPDFAQIKNLGQSLKLENLLDMIRTKEPEYKQAKLNQSSSTQDILNAIVQYPKLLERPIVITPKGARICRPPEVVKDLL